MLRIFCWVAAFAGACSALDLATKIENPLGHSIAVAFIVGVVMVASYFWGRLDELEKDR